MRILVWPLGDENDGSAQYRLMMPAKALHAQGADIVVRRGGPVVVWDREFEGDPPDDAVVMGVYPPNADVVVLQRPARRFWGDCIPFIQSYGIKVVVDIDDRFDRIHRDHVGRANYDPKRHEVSNHEWVDRACKLADLVTTTTPALCARYGYGHGVVLPNLVPERYLKIGTSRAPTVGWTGTAETHAGDLEAAGTGVGRITTASGWDGRVVGTGVGVGEKLGFKKIVATGWLPFAEYPKFMARFGVGLVPLADTQFNRAKSCLKQIEFASLGVPVIASATPDNKRMYKAGIGLLAQSCGDFERHLATLLHDDHLREDLAAHGRKVMAAHTIEGNCGRWWDAWTSTVTKPLRKAA